jgi:hypothetical protein
MNVTDPSDDSVRMIIRGKLHTSALPYLTAVVHPVESYVYYDGKKLGKTQIDDMIIDNDIVDVTGDSKVN